MNTSHTLPRVIPAFGLSCMLLGVSLLGLSTQAMADNSKPLQPISASEWNADKARHLLERAGFGGTPQEVARLAVMTPEQAVKTLVRYQSTPDSFVPFDDSGSHDDGLEPFASSRPAATDLAKASGESLGVKVKPEGNRRVQQVADRYLYWLRASRLETHRLGYWWADRMLSTPRPFQEKLTLFWHGHFATSEEKVRDYRKLLIQNESLRLPPCGCGAFRLLPVAALYLARPLAVSPAPCLTGSFSPRPTERTGPFFLAIEHYCGCSC